MPGYFISPDGDLENIFVDDYNVIDQYARTGSLWSFGYNTNGTLGTNNTTNYSSPVQTVSGGTNWKLVSSHSTFSAAIKTDGTLWLWGNNTFGQLGNNNITNYSSPVQTVSGGTNWKQVDVGKHTGFARQTAAIKNDGTLWLWGDNGSGRLGDNTTVSKSSPVQTVSGGTNWKLVSVGSYLVSAIKTDGTLWSWGYNTFGCLGDNTTAHKSSPVQTVAGGTNWKQVSSGQFHTGAIKNDGTLWLWGYNNYGQLGTNNTTNYSSPVQTIASGTNWKQVSSGQFQSAAIKTNGTLWLWGQNNYGQLGTNNTTNYSSPVQTIASGTNWKQLALTGTHTAAIKTDGTLWSWGRNQYGGLGTNNTTNYSSPVQTVAGGTNWKQVSCGSTQNFASGSTAAIHFYDAGNLYPSA